MRSRTTLAAVLMTAALVAPSSAAAAGQLQRPVPGEALLAFGVPYASRVHHGLDLAAEAGESVAAPAEGTVTFAGRLPGEGGAVGVTLQTDEGLKVTCLPLATTSVAKGERIQVGADLGEVSAEGDASSDRPHVHLSVRQGDTYVDPAPLLAAPPAVAEPAEPEAEPARQAAGERTAAEGDAVATPEAAGAAVEAAEGPVTDAVADAATGAAPSGAPAGAGSPASAVLKPLRHTASSALGRHASSSPRRITRVSHAASGGALSAIVARVRSSVAMIAELLVALALLWPVWRRLSQPVELHEALPVRGRS